ncbi:MAG: hypothetical protein ED558_17490 [Oricola sp.]|nr:MAG: hypothetical protein ED558_17490 [Oricola sp.]
MPVRSVADLEELLAELNTIDRNHHVDVGDFDIRFATNITRLPARRSKETFAKPSLEVFALQTRFGEAQIRNYAA